MENSVIATDVINDDIILNFNKKHITEERKIKNGKLQIKTVLNIDLIFPPIFLLFSATNFVILNPSAVPITVTILKIEKSEFSSPYCAVSKILPESI